MFEVSLAVLPESFTNSLLARIQVIRNLKFLVSPVLIFRVLSIFLIMDSSVLISVRLNCF